MESIDVAGRPRTYTLVTPDGGDYDRLLIVFHGSTQNAGIFRRFTGNAFDRLDRTAVAYLDGYRGNWNDARRLSSTPARLAGVDDVAFTEAIVKRFGDGRETIAAGYSNGGGMVIRLLHERPDLLAGGAIIAAQQPAPDNFLLSGTPALPVVPKPVLLIHGTKDRIIPYGGGRMAAWARFAFRSGGALLSAPETAAYFARRNGITTDAVTTILPHAADRTSASRTSASRTGRTSAGRTGRTTVSRTDYAQDGRPPVTLFTVHGGGHTIPGPTPSPALMGRTATDLHAATAIAEFFGR
ncbi:alpha/beta hydrolase family esterase [Actinoplanes sp. CA-015351]|uniref:alpha/beta hydrolase family esterase n=1 Tax=Actinoplanes sp. CA-015351 TaxID=3239897 RepID=UPI003D951C7B